MEKELLYKFFNRETTPTEEKAIAEWFEASEENRQAMFHERRLYDTMLMMPEEKIKPRRMPSRSKRMSLIKASLRYTAVFIAAAGLSIALLSLYDNKKSHSLTNTISVPAGQRLNITLSDGTKIFLNSLSQLEYPTRFSGKNRRVKLNGEGFFEVRKQQGSKFIVETYAYDIEVLGTEFNVEAYQDTETFSTSLVNGVVKVKERENDKNSVILTEKQRVTCVDHSLKISHIPENECFMWRNGLIEFNSECFEKMIEKFKKYYGVDIVVNSDKLPENEFTGKLRISDGIDHALWVLGQSSDFRYRWDDARETIYIH